MLGDNQNHVAWRNMARPYYEVAHSNAQAAGKGAIRANPGLVAAYASTGGLIAAHACECMMKALLVQATGKFERHYWTHDCTKLFAMLPSDQQDRLRAAFSKATVNLKPSEQIQLDDFLLKFANTNIAWRYMEGASIFNASNGMLSADRRCGVLRKNGVTELKPHGGALVPSWPMTTWPLRSVCDHSDDLEDYARRQLSSVRPEGCPLSEDERPRLRHSPSQHHLPRAPRAKPADPTNSKISVRKVKAPR